MSKVIMSINGKDYESEHDNWDSVDECMDYCFQNQDENEFPGYDGDGSEGGSVRYRLESDE